MNKEELQHNIFYSDKYYDDKYEYRHVLIPKELVKYVPKTHLMSEDEWRSIGIQQSKGWIHYMTHKPAYRQVYIGPKVAGTMDECQQSSEMKFMSDMLRRVEPHVLLFKRPITEQPEN